MKPEFLISLAARLRAHSRRTRLRGTALAVDMRCAAMAADRFAALMVAEEASRQNDPARRKDLEREAVNLWQHR